MIVEFGIASGIAYSGCRILSIGIEDIQGRKTSLEKSIHLALFGSMIMMSMAFAFDSVKDYTMLSTTMIAAFTAYNIPFALMFWQAKHTLRRKRKLSKYPKAVSMVVISGVSIFVEACFALQGIQFQF